MIGAQSTRMPSARKLDVKHLVQAGLRNLTIPPYNVDEMKAVTNHYEATGVVHDRMSS